MLSLDSPNSFSARKKQRERALWRSANHIVRGWSGFCFAKTPSLSLRAKLSAFLDPISSFNLLPKRGENALDSTLLSQIQKRPTHASFTLSDVQFWIRFVCLSVRPLTRVTRLVLSRNWLFSLRSVWKMKCVASCIHTCEKKSFAMNFNNVILFQTP